MTITNFRSFRLPASPARLVQDRSIDRSAGSVRLSEEIRMPLSVFSRVAAVLVVGLIEWNDRRSSRSELMTLSDHDLLDIGITKGAAKFEGRKPFYGR
jgi:uncharacterized protein YjiS (DUF1127 family)